MVYRVSTILLQLIDGKHPMIYTVSTCFNEILFGGAGFRKHDTITSFSWEMGYDGFLAMGRMLI